MNTFAYRGKRKRDYFEGWYLRLFNNDVNMAFIFAVTFNQDDPHAFIQVFDGRSVSTEYFRFPLEAFRYEDATVFIGENRLSESHVRVKVGGYDIDGTISDHVLPGRSSIGLLRYAPLQCFQEVVWLSASADIAMPDGEKTEVYLEKTYGRRFPKRWFWLHAPFDDGVLSFAGGIVPVPPFETFAFFALFHHEEETVRFATYNRASLRIEEGKTVSFLLKKGGHTLFIDAERGDEVPLVGPGERARMQERVMESLNAKVRLRYMKGERRMERRSAEAGFEWMYNE